TWFPPTVRVKDAPEGIEPSQWPAARGMLGEACGSLFNARPNFGMLQRARRFVKTDRSVMGDGLRPALAVGQGDSDPREIIDAHVVFSAFAKVRHLFERNFSLPADLKGSLVPT